MLYLITIQHYSKVALSNVKQNILLREYFMTKSSVLKVIGISAGVVSLVAGGAGVGFAISSVANKDIKGDTNVISLDTSASYLQNTTGHQSLTISSKLNDKPSTIITLTSDDTTYTTLDKTTNTLALKVGIDIPHEAPDVTITASAKNAIDQHVKITLKSNDPIPDV
ncbi:hypothetical protein FACS1894166_11450 [Bacilli bacterium]|nr:hypothetical protein FACS1894166_11450 [Bacilli bacterium]